MRIWTRPMRSFECLLAGRLITAQCGQQRLLQRRTQSTRERRGRASNIHIPHES